MDTSKIVQFPPQTRRTRRVNSWRWNELEEDALEGLPHAAQILYLRVIRKHMDFGTAISGRKRRISYAQMQEKLRYVPPARSNDKVVEYSTDQIKKLIRKLVSAGLIERLHDTSKGVAPMEFYLPLACSDEQQAGHERAMGSEPQENPHGRASDDGERATSGPRLEGHSSGSVTPLPHNNSAREFPMTLDWEPVAQDMDALLGMNGSDLKNYLTDDVLLEFKSFWMTRPNHLTQAEWHHKLVSALKSEKQRVSTMQDNRLANDGREGIPPCPHESILAAWDEILGNTKGKAPHIIDWKGTKIAVALEERWREFYGDVNSGKARYSDLQGGIEWFRKAFMHFAGSPNFCQAEVGIFDVFYKTRFTKAANGNLPAKGGAVR